MKEEYNQLCELTKEIASLEPWEWLKDEDLIEIVYPDQDQIFYCSIIGNDQDICGISVYKGFEGYADFKTLMRNPYPTPEEFILSDINCLSCFFCQTDELEQFQIEVSGFDENTDMSFYFVSLEKRFYPSYLNDEEIEVLCKVYTSLYKVLKQYLNHNTLQPDWEHGEMLRLKNNHLSIVNPLEEINKYGYMILDDSYYEEVSGYDRIDEDLYMDLMYMNVPISDDEGIYDKEINPLAFYMLDENLDLIHIEMIPIEVEECFFIFDCVLDYFEEYGLPRTIHCRNPYVKAALEDVCEKLHIELDYQEFPEIDEQLDFVN